MANVIFKHDVTGETKRFPTFKQAMKWLKTQRKAFNWTQI